MRIAHTLKDFRAWRGSLSGHVGFTPSLGCMHDGHRALLRASVGENDASIVSIFVNPTQFGRGEDFDKYPRDLEHDAEICRSEGVDMLFAPSVAEMYPPGNATRVSVAKFRGVLCDASRPQLFDGVATIVTKLFSIVRPDRAYFGKKDYQQLRIIEQLTLDLNLGTAIRRIETVREPSGLAGSTRNQYLSADERRAGARLYKALQHCRQRYLEGRRDAAGVLDEATGLLAERSPTPSIEYLAAVDRDTLEPVSTLTANTLIAVAANVGKARLIDNIELVETP